MTPRYETAQRPRFSVENLDGVQRFTIRPPRNVLAAGFLAVPAAVLAAVGVSGVSLMLPLLAPRPLHGVEGSFPATLYGCIVVVVLALAFGLSSVLLTLSWMLGGAEILDVHDGDLAVTHRMLGLARTKRYRGSDIGDIAGHVASPLRASQGSVPLLWTAATGSVRFTYGARTVYLAQDLDDSEGRLLAAALRESLKGVASARGRGAGC